MTEPCSDRSLIVERMNSCVSFNMSIFVEPVITQVANLHSFETLACQYVLVMTLKFISLILYSISQ